MGRSAHRAKEGRRPEYRAARCALSLSKGESGYVGHNRGMCRNIRPLNNFEPAATSAEVHDAALQYVRKIAGTSKPSKANEAVFNRAVEEIAHATQHLLDELVSTAPPKNREDGGGQSSGAIGQSLRHRCTVTAEILRYAAFTVDGHGGNPAGVVLDATRPRCRSDASHRG